MNCIIIDDEALARKLLESYAEKAGISVLESFASPTVALQFLRSTQVDLIFVDINMPNLSGLELLKSLNDPPMAIITTAYGDYALESFELNVIDYLKKPYAFDRFMKGVNKAMAQKQLQEAASRKEAATADFFFVKSEYQLIKIQYKELQYIEGFGEYVKIHTGGKPIISLLSLSKLIKELPKNSFIRVHKSYIVNFNYIDSYHQNTLFIGDKDIPVGQTRKAALLKALKEKGIF